jgi:hypothetical protein
MIGKPVDWNAVVLGAWNVAILTPRGVAQRLFKLDVGTPVEVQVQIDQPGPLRINHDGVGVIPSATALIAIPASPTLTGLRRAAEIVARGVESLPHTPVTAAGVNLRYRFAEVPDELLALTAGADDLFADGDLPVVSRVTKRSIRWKSGLLNLEIHQNEDATCEVVVNFHRQSSEGADLTAWLGSTEAMVEQAKKLLTTTLKLKIEDADVE